jgi:hypothetical protein
MNLGRLTKKNNTKPDVQVEDPELRTKRFDKGMEELIWVLEIEMVESLRTCHSLAGA